MLEQLKEKSQMYIVINQGKTADFAPILKSIFLKEKLTDFRQRQSLTILENFLKFENYVLYKCANCAVLKNSGRT